MASETDKMAWFGAGSSENFALHILPLFSGPQVKIRVGKGKEHSVSRPLLCAKSSYFKAMFEKGFSEKEATSVTLEPIDGVVSEKSLEALFQWLYTGKVQFDLSETHAHISAIIELARLADMCGITVIESHLVKAIRKIMTRNLDPYGGQTPYTSGVLHTKSLVNSHIASAAKLPSGHPVRHLLAQAAADEFIGKINHVLAEGIPELIADVHQQINIALNGIETKDHNSYVTSLVFPNVKIRVRSGSTMMNASTMMSARKHQELRLFDEDFMFKGGEGKF